MNEEKVYIRTFPIVWLITIIVLIVLWVVTKERQFVISYLLGVSTCLFASSIQFKRLMKIAKQEHPDVDKLRTNSYFFIAVKSLLYISILVLSVVNDKLNIFFTFAGIMTFSIVLIVNVLLSNKVGEQNE